MKVVYVILGILCGVILIYVITEIVKKIKKYRKEHPKEKKIKVKKRKNVNDKYIRSGSLSLKTNYITQKEVNFLRVVNQSLPTDHIMLPKIKLYDLVSPVGSRVNYDKISDKIVDFCIFELKAMKPKVVIDLYDDTFVNQELFVEDPLVVEALEEVKIPVEKIKVQREYSQGEISSLIEKYCQNKGV